MSRSCNHVEMPGRKPGTLRCKLCSWTFPCREDNCGHLDCIDFKQKLPTCYYCGERVKGGVGGWAMPTSTFEPIRKSATEQEATWTIWNVRGVTRAVHYYCRDSVATPTEIKRWGGRTPCSHTFDGKGEVGQDNSEQAEEAKEAAP